MHFINITILTIQLITCWVIYWAYIDPLQQTVTIFNERTRAREGGGRKFMCVYVCKRGGRKFSPAWFAEEKKMYGFWCKKCLFSHVKTLESSHGHNITKREDRCVVSRRIFRLATAPSLFQYYMPVIHTHTHTHWNNISSIYFSVG